MIKEFILVGHVGIPLQLDFGVWRVMRETCPWVHREEDGPVFVALGLSL